MPDERRYNEAEIERIFESAAHERQPRTESSAYDGLTLAELQAIGGEVGLPPQRIADAAASLDRRDEPRRLTVAGAPIGVQMSFPLSNAPSDREWAMLVAELRRTFKAEGRVTSLGDLREWRNGNLYATVEPTELGYQLRMGTRKGQVLANVLLSSIAFMIAWGALQDGAVLGPVLLLLLGLLSLGSLLGLPRWARQREAQMEQIGQWATKLIGPPVGQGEPTG